MNELRNRLFDHIPADRDEFIGCGSERQITRERSGSTRVSTSLLRRAAPHRAPTNRCFMPAAIAEVNKRE